MYSAFGRVAGIAAGAEQAANGADWVARGIAIAGVLAAGANFLAGRREAYWKRRAAQIGSIAGAYEDVSELIAAAAQSSHQAILQLWSATSSAALRDLKEAIADQADRKLKKQLSRLYAEVLNFRGTDAPSEEEAHSGNPRFRTQRELQSLSNARDASLLISKRFELIRRKSGGAPN